MPRFIRWTPDPEFEIVFTEVFPRATLLARRIVGDQASAEDIAAEALARAFASWSKVRSLPYRNAWILRTTTNLAIDATRKRKHTTRSATPQSFEDTSAQRIALAAALHTLPRRQREAIALKYLADLTDAETAQALGVAVGTVKSHVHRGLKSLREHLGDATLEAMS